MTVAVQQSNKQQKDPLDTVLKGLQIAGSVYGIREASAKLDEIDAQKKAREDQAAGVITPQQEAGLAEKGFLRVPDGTSGAVAMKRSSDGSAVAFAPPKPKSELAIPKFETYRGQDGKNHIGKVGPQGLMQSPDDALAGTQPKDLLPPKEKPPKLTSGPEAVQIGAFDSALGTVDDLASSWNGKASATGSSLKQYVKGTEANKYGNERKQAAQTIGRVLEGGKLSDQDVGRYEAMLPGPEDSPDQARNKVISLKKKVVAQRNSQIQGLGSAGYDVSGFQLLPIDNIDTIIGKNQGTSGTAIAAPMPKQGHVEDGYVFQGGNPSDPKSWKKK